MQKQMVKETSCIKRHVEQLKISHLLTRTRVKTQTEFKASSYIMTEFLFKENKSSLVLLSVHHTI